MPRKFLGDRIERTVDAVRPSSLTLTADDLKHIPVIPQDFTDDDDRVLSNGNGEKRLSKRFGGTLLLKKRLESVPELFLHDYKKKPHSKLDVIKEKNSRKHLPASKAAMKSKGNRILLQEKNRVGSLPLQRKSLCRSALPRFTVTQPVEHTERWEPLIDRVFVSQPTPIVLPIQTVAPMNPVAVIQKQTQDCHGRNKYGKSDSEILFDEILSAYENIPKKNSTALNSEIDRIIDICSSKNLAKDMKTFQTPQIVCPDDTETLFSPTTPKLKPTKFGTLNDIISSPEYSTSGGSTYSEHWSSEDELPELESNIWSTPKSAIRSSIVSDSTNEEGYCTAAETIPSTASVEDLDIHNTLPASVHKPLNSVLLNRLSMRKLKKINLAPPKIIYMMNIGDESDEDYVEGDTTLRMLQEKIDSIEIASCSSSMYSN